MATFLAQIKPLVLLRFSQISWRSLAVISLLCLATGMSWQLIAFYQTAFYPQTYVNGVLIGDKTLIEAEKFLISNRPLPPIFNLTLKTDANFVASSSTELQASYDYNRDLNQIFQKTHNLTLWLKIKNLFVNQPNYFATKIEVSPEKVTNLVSLLAEQTDTPGLKPTVTLATSGNANSLKVDPGKTGQSLKVAESNQAVLESINQFSAELSSLSTWGELAAASQTGQITKLIATAPLETSFVPLSESQISLVKTAATTLVGKQLKLALENQTFYLNDQKLVPLLNPDQTQQEKVLVKPIETEISLVEKSLPSQPVNAEFDFDPATLVVANFKPGKPGLKLKTDSAVTAVKNSLNNWLNQAETKALVEIPLEVTAVEPERTLASTNNLGISELVGFGESYYGHSIPTRVHNVALTAKKINLTIVKPGDEFSFNKTLGEVSAKTGFQPAYVIKSGRTELGDGGGVCQVSSTLFRSLLDAGLDITKRLPHSYRVTYYELNSDPGFDATVYAGNVDLRFVNDTPGHILIYTETDSQKLWMKIELYGTKDGRVATVTDYKKWGAAPPPPTEYIPDASLPTGKKKQIDWSASGLKASFVYTVRAADGSLKQQETYTSVYKPWSAKYLVGI